MQICVLVIFNQLNKYEEIEWTERRNVAMHLQ